MVVGHCREELEAVLERLEVRVLVNERHGEGMFSSVLRAIGDLDDVTGAVFVHPVDIPLVLPWTLSCLVERHVQDREKILIPTFRGRRGHPVAIPGMHLDAVRSFSGENGLRVRWGSSLMNYSRCRWTTGTFSSTWTRRKTTRNA